MAESTDVENPTQKKEADVKLEAVLRPSCLSKLPKIKWFRRPLKSVTTVGASPLTDDPNNKASSSTRSTSKWSKFKEICDPRGKYVPEWKNIFVISCVFAVSLDPLFLYILILDQDNKCLQIDRVLSFTALLLRSITDAIFLVHLMIGIYFGVKTQRTSSKTLSYTCFTAQTNGGRSSRKLKLRDQSAQEAKKIAQRISWLSGSIVIDFLAILPIPQIVTFNNMRGSGYLEHKKVLNLLLLGQYIPRICRIHVYANQRTYTTGIWLKALLYIFLYILASHVLGAFWYFFSIQRETSCWHLACVNHSRDRVECINTFYCDSRTATSRNITFLNEHCPLYTPDNGSPPFNFGIFLDSLKNQNTEHIKFGKKFFYSLWWGLRNLSNFGTNLTTSTYVWENLFAILISIVGLLLFLYLIGNVQTFMQMKTTKSEEIRQKIKMRKLDILTWISRNKLPDDIKKEIMDSIRQKSKDKDAVLQDDLLFILPPQTRKSVKRCLCLEPLKTVPMLENMDDKVLRMMCDFLKPVMYNENSFPFRMGDPLDRMLFINEGTMWTYSRTDTEASSLARNPLEKGQFYGEELLKWASSRSSDFPISTRHVKSQTKVEAFALMAMDLAIVVHRYQLLWNVNNPYISQKALRDMACSRIHQAARRWRRLKVGNPHLCGKF